MTNNTWKQSSLSEITLLIKDGTHGTHKDTADGIPLLSAKDIHDGIVETDNNPRRISKSDYETIHKNYEIKKGDILLTIVGTIGRSAIVNDVSNKFTIQRSVAVLRMNDSVIPEYAHQFIRSDVFQRGLTQGSQGLAQSGIYLGELGKKQIPVPPKNVQQKIGDILSSIDEAIQKTDQIIQKSEQLKQGLISNLFSKKTQANWVIYKLGDATRFIDYRGKTPTKVQEGIPLITAKNVRMGFIEREPREYIKIEDYDSWMTRGIPREGDVLFTTEAPLGNVAQIDTHEKLAFAQRVIIMQPIKEVNPTFLKYLLMSDLIQLIIKSLSTGGTVKGIKAKVLKQIEIPIPPLREQQKIAQMMTDCDEKISKEKKFKNKLLILKVGLMHDIFNQKVQIN